MQDIVIPKDIINKLVMNYLIVEGYKQGAMKFEKETGIKGKNKLFNKIQLKWMKN